ncbi:MAG: hypothetical protein MUC92_00150 [Fimbriimonadaceae bacterium]|jgi:hypothetical protein|nr:hypothetical protein [Fimbriimonadaceae bacterium]
MKHSETTEKTAETLTPKSHSRLVALARLLKDRAETAERKRLAEEEAKRQRAFLD